MIAVGTYSCHCCITEAFHRSLLSLVLFAIIKVLPRYYRCISSSLPFTVLAMYPKSIPHYYSRSSPLHLREENKVALLFLRERIKT